MKRTFNYTGRIRLEKQQVDLAVRDVTGVLHAEGRIRFEESAQYGPDARVLLYFRRGPIRRGIDIGPVRPEVRFSETLADFPDADGLAVDVRVFDSADPARRLLALARGVRGGSEDDRSRISLLPARLGDFDVPVWRVHMDFEHGPYLEFSKRCGDFRRLARSEEFLALVLPAVVRQIAYELLVKNRYEQDPEEEEDGEARWMRFLIRLPGVDPYRPDMDPTQREDLVEQIEQAFARYADVLRHGATLLGVTGEDMD